LKVQNTIDSNKIHLANKLSGAMGNPFVVSIDFALSKKINIISITIIYEEKVFHVNVTGEKVYPAKIIKILFIKSSAL
jgi:hypothetical protein